MTVARFRVRKPGPELEIEDAVTKNASNLFPHIGPRSCALGSVPIGAGLPDLVYLGCEPIVSELTEVDFPATQILAYLHSVSRARSEKIMYKLGRSSREISTWLEQLLEVGAIVRLRVAYELDPQWRGILPNVITVEAKVTDWRRAFNQAARNRLFARESYVALPFNTAERLKCRPEFVQLGIGIIAVNGDEAIITRKARVQLPRIWEYYYRLAFIAAEHIEEKHDAL